VELTPLQIIQIEQAISLMEKEYNELADSLPEIDLDTQEIIEVPNSITKENAFLDPNYFQNYSQANPSALLQKHSDKMFHPTEARLDDQCFNLCDFLAAFILVRLIYFRDNTPSYTLSFSSKELNEDPLGCIDKNLSFLDYIIKGFWIGVNTDFTRTPQQQYHWKTARQLFAKHWDSFWC